MPLFVGNAASNALIGTNVADTLLGLAGNDALVGLNGNDFLNGGVGADLMAGGSGNDRYVVDNIGDRVAEGAFEGVDTVFSSISLSLNAYVGIRSVENLTMLAGAVNASGNALSNVITGNSVGNIIEGQDGNDFLIGGGGGDALRGGTGNDRLDGGAGNDFLGGGAGADLMRGGIGFDNFVFNTAPNAVDTITDFSHAFDTMRLENAIFTGLAPGVLSAAAFRDGPVALDATDRIIYNEVNGHVSFDADGNGAIAPIHFATLIGSPNNVDRFDFLVI